MIIFPGPDVPKTSNAVISIESILLGLDIDGVKWRYTEFTGWTGGAAVETNSQPRPGAHGNLPGPVYRRERVISLSGQLVANSRSLAVTAQDELEALLADGSTGTFTVDDPDLGVRSASVHLSGTPLVDDAAAGAGVVRWSLQFTCDDWRKYGDTQDRDTALPGGGTGMGFPMAFPMEFGDPGNPGRIQFTNDGRAPTEPTFTVTPSMLSGFEITRVETGQRLRYEHPVMSTLTVDCAAGTVLEAGERRERYLTVREWPSIGPGETATFQFSTLGSETFADPAHLYGSSAPAYP